MMAYRMKQIGDGTVRIGFPSNGDANIEVWTKPWGEPGAELEAEIMIPIHAIDDLATALLRREA